MQENNFISGAEQSWPSKAENYSEGLLLSQNIKLIVLLGKELKIREERNNAESVNQEKRIRNMRDHEKSLHLQDKVTERSGQDKMWFVVFLIDFSSPHFSSEFFLAAGSLSPLYIMKAPTHFTLTDGTSLCNIKGSFTSQINPRGSMPPPSLLSPHPLLFKISHDQEPKHFFSLPEFMNSTYLRKDCKSRTFLRLQIASAIRN